MPVYRPTIYAVSVPRHAPPSAYRPPNGGFVPDSAKARSFVINQIGGFVFKKAISFQPSASAFDHRVALSTGHVLTLAAGLATLDKTVAQSPDFLPYSATSWQNMAEFGAILYKREASKRARLQIGA